MITDLVKLKPHFAILIIFHLVCTICVGHLAIIVYNEPLFHQLDAFKLIILSFSITAPLTAMNFIFLMGLVRLDVPIVLESDGTKTLSMLAASMTLVTFLTINFLKYSVDSWNTSDSVRVILGLTFCFFGFWLGAVFMQKRRQKRSRKAGRADLVG